MLADDPLGVGRRKWAIMALLTLSACSTPDKAALKEYTPQSPEADIEAVSLSASDHDTFDPERVGTEFPDTTKQVAVWYRWKEAELGKQVGIRWSKGGEVVLEQIDTLLKPAGASAYVLKMGAGSNLPGGAYQVELLEDGAAVTKIPFRVGAGDGSDVAVVPADALAEDDAQAASADADSAPAAEGAPDEPAAEVTTPEAQVTPPAPSTGGAVLAFQETKWPGVVVEVTELVRKGNALNAKLRFTNKGSKEVKPDFYYRDTYALDENNQKYEVLKDDRGGYLGSVSSGYNDWWGENIEPGASRTAWMRFAAPPAGVKTITLQVGNLDPFEDLQIQN